MNKLLCLLGFHKWLKWEQYDRPVIVLPGIIAPPEARGREFHGMERRQRRSCEECGKEQDRLVRDV